MYTATSNVIENEMMENKIKNANTMEVTSKRKPIPPMWRILGKARKLFDAQLKKTNEVKLQCINNFMTAEVQDQDKFWADFMAEVNKLLDSKRYESECKRLNVNSKILATHIVFLGKTVINKVLENGISSTLGVDYMLYKDVFTPESASVYIVDYADEDEVKDEDEGEVQAS